MSAVSPAASERGEFHSTGNNTWGIFLVSVLGLFLELLLIRWIGTEVRIFAYLQNTILVVCFLGLGMGCFSCRKPVYLRRMLLPLLGLATLLAVPWTYQALSQISNDFSSMGLLFIWEYPDNEPDGRWMVAWRLLRGVSLTLLLMVLVWEIFLPLGRLLGRWMDDYRGTIKAYSVNVAGSLLGIWLFVGMSALFLPPVLWFVAAGVMLLWFVAQSRQRLLNFGLIAATVVAAWAAGRAPGVMETHWSPYQKLVLMPITDPVERQWGDLLINVNNVGYQGMVDLSEEAVANHPGIPAEQRGLSQYDVPVLLKPEPKKVLIVGAGSGNDVAGALRGGAEHVTAVDIDPAIIDMGRRYHPERPYDSERVTVVNDDARSFFATTSERYDLIIFGLLDSHTTTSMTNARLDHYVYTRESLAKAKELLADGGVMTLSFMVQKPFVADRMARTLRDVFGREPLVFARATSRLGWGGTMFVAGDWQVIEEQLAAHPRLAEQIAAWQEQTPVELTYTTPAATDDWPYIYLETRHIPGLYLVLAGLMGVLFYYGVRRCQIGNVLSGWSKSHWHFFFLGAAFLLLEVQNISKAAVVLGNTWQVNAVIIAGILLMILLANLLAAKLPRLSAHWVAVGLIGSCLALYAYDLASLAFLSYPVKAAVVGLLTALPMLFSGIFFIRSFAITPRKDLALGANLFGALVGSLLQSITFLTGTKALLLIVAGLYMLALATRPKGAKLPAADTQEQPAREEAELVGV